MRALLLLLLLACDSTKREEYARYAAAATPHTEALRALNAKFETGRPEDLLDGLGATSARGSRRQARRPTPTPR